MSPLRYLPTPVQQLFEQIDALTPEHWALFQDLLLTGTRDQETGAVLRPGLLDSSAVRARIEPLEQLATHWGGRAAHFAGQLAAYYRQRNRKRAPETVQQDAEIAELREADRRHWTWKRLGNRFGMTASGARKAYQRHCALRALTEPKPARNPQPA